MQYPIAAATVSSVVISNPICNTNAPRFVETPQDWNLELLCAYAAPAESHHTCTKANTPLNCDCSSSRRQGTSSLRRGSRTEHRWQDAAVNVLMCRTALSLCTLVQLDETFHGCKVVRFTSYEITIRVSLQQSSHATGRAQGADHLRLPFLPFLPRFALPLSPSS
jgi:hypothetical protein